MSSSLHRGGHLCRSCRWTRLSPIAGLFSARRLCGKRWPACAVCHDCAGFCTQSHTTLYPIEPHVRIVAICRELRIARGITVIRKMLPGGGRMWRFLLVSVVLFMTASGCNCSRCCCQNQCQSYATPAASYSSDAPPYLAPANEDPAESPILRAPPTPVAEAAE